MGSEADICSMAHYTPRTFTLNGTHLKADISHHIRRFARPEVSARRITRTIKNFFILATKGKSWLRIMSDTGEWLEAGVYRDGDYSFVVFEGDPSTSNDRWGPYLGILCVGFDIIRRQGKKIVLIKQIQSTRRPQEKAHRMLRTIRWERVLIALVEEWAQCHGCHATAIIRATQSEWYDRSIEKIKKLMYLRYDKTAKRAGYRFDHTLGFWMKPITPHSP